MGLMLNLLQQMHTASSIPVQLLKPQQSCWQQRKQS